MSFSSENPLEKAKFTFASGYKLESASGLGWKNVFTSRIPSGENLCQPHACMMPQAYVGRFCCVQKALF